jgi:RNA polymerase sigma-70 factor (ECF subfamily)
MSREEALLKLRERLVGFAAFRMQRDFAEDLAQETLVVLEEKYKHVAAIEELVPLAIQIMRFKMAGVRRKAARHGAGASVSVEDVQIADPAANVELDVGRREMLDRIAGAMSRMGDRCRELFRLKLQGRTYAEIQKELGAASINTVYTWDARCRRELLERVGGSWEAKR